MLTINCLTAWNLEAPNQKYIYIRYVRKIGCFTNDNIYPYRFFSIAYSQREQFKGSFDILMIKFGLCLQAYDSTLL